MKSVSAVVSIILLAGFLSLPGVARAGGWVVVSLDRVPTGVIAGEEFIVGFRVLPHGRPIMNGALEGLEAHIEAVHQGTGSRLTFPAPSAGEPGHHVARVTLPGAGTWDWAVVVFDGPHTMYPLEVHPEGWSAGGATEVPAAGARQVWRWVAMASGVGAGLTLLATAGVAAGVPIRRIARTG